MNFQFTNLTRFAVIAGLALSLGLPVLAQDTGNDQRPTPEERQAQREQQRKEFLAKNPDVANAIEAQVRSQAGLLSAGLAAGEEPTAAAAGED